MGALAVILSCLVAAAAPAQTCVGDCDGSGDITIDEILTGVSIAVGAVPVEACAAFDIDLDGAVTVDEVLVGVNLALHGCPPAEVVGYPRDADLRLNHIQVMGSHNSYHIPPQGRLARFLSIDAWQYTHLPLEEQFEHQGVRTLELDIFADPEGGMYANPAGAQRAGDPFDVPEMLLPGFKTLHVQDLDFQSNCWTFIDCLSRVKRWSDANPGHVPIAILVEVKDEEVPLVLPGFDLTVPIPTEKEHLDALDAEIRSVFPPEQIITPDEVRGEHETLEEAVRTDGWPTLAASRGRVLFLLDNGGRIKDLYIDGHPSLRGRILFTSSAPGEPEAGFVKLNDSIGSFERIQELVQEGFIVRTRADGDTVEARTGDTTRRDAALASGAQFVHTDFPEPDPQFASGYFVQIPGGTPARCNPVSAPLECASEDIEDPRFLRWLWR